MNYELHEPFWITVYQWQTLIAGALGLGGGLIAYFGALRAAKQEVDAANEQLADSRLARTQSNKRRLSAIVWALVAETRRLAATAERWEESLPRGTGKIPFTKPELKLASGPALRGEREDISLLNIDVQAQLAALLRALDDYNLSIEVSGTWAQGHIAISDETLRRPLGHLIAAAQTAHKSLLDVAETIGRAAS